MRVVAISDLRAWADEVIALEATESLPTRIVVVPTEAHAHGLRRELATRAPRALAGTRFVTAGAAARAVLDAASVGYVVGEEERRPLRIRKLLRAGVGLRLYPAGDLVTRGWQVAFASTIEQLEAAALRPEDLDGLDDDRANDLATIWRALDADADGSWTLPRIFEEARTRLQEWPFTAPVLAAVTAGITAAEARFIRELPRLTLGVVPGRPVRTRLVERVRVLFGDSAAEALARVRSEPRPDELGLLAELFFEPPERLAAPDRRRSAGPDGTVALELYAGVDEELDAAARWIAEQVVEHRTPLHEIAILVPRPEPFAPLLAARIRALAWPDDIEPVYVACGMPAMATAAGARLRALVGAVQEHLPADAVVALLPRLRLAGDDGHLTPGQAREIVDALATTGGSTTRPTDALRWRDRLGHDDLPQRTGDVRSAIEALVAIAEIVLADAPLRHVWEAIEAFAATHLIASRELALMTCQLASEIEALAADPVTDGIVGGAAVDLILERLEAMRIHAGRFGEPAVYVGTIAGAAGLRFSAVRIIGLAEGVFPGTLREDALLPHDLRCRLGMLTDDDYATSRLQALDRVVRDVAQRLVLSAPRTDVEGSEREPASLFIEAAAALARPNAITGTRACAIPSMSDIERDAFTVARTANASARDRLPISEACWLVHASQSRNAIPSSWAARAITDPTGIAERSRLMDGLLGPAPLAVTMFGLDRERPLSASSIRMLLTCPQRFLLERMIGMRPRRRGAQSHRIDPAAYGKLVHRILDRFAREYGEPFGRRERDLPHWLGLAAMIVDDELAAFPYPLAGVSIVENERRRLWRDVEVFICDDWNAGRPRELVASEQEFGPLAVASASGPVFVRGYIDRIDIESGMTLVRELKTSRARPREGDELEPSLDLDLQLAVYMAVVRELELGRDMPAEVVGAYAYLDAHAPIRERAFRDDRHALGTAGARWLAVAGALIREQSFVRSPDANDCKRCPFAAVCGDDTARTTEVLRDATGALAAYRELKT